MSGTFDRAVREALRQTYRDSILVGGELSTDYADKHAPRVAAELRAALLADGWTEPATVKEPTP